MKIETPERKRDRMKQYPAFHEFKDIGLFQKKIKTIYIYARHNDTTTTKPTTPNI